eukprot:4209144-Pleurochrysis_carterae.AAC.1
MCEAARARLRAGLKSTRVANAKSRRGAAGGCAGARRPRPVARSAHRLFAARVEAARDCVTGPSQWRSVARRSQQQASQRTQEPTAQACAPR